MVGLMNRQAVPSDEHVVRTIGKQHWDEVETPRGIVPVANSDVFRPREDYPPGTGPEECISVDWLDYFAGDLRHQLDAVREAVRARGRTVGRRARLGEL